MVCLSSDISANLLVASIAEELTNTIKGIDIDKTDRNKILTNLLEINSIVEKSKSSQKFSTFKSQLEEIQLILNEPIHKSWMDKILTKTQQLINFMMNHSHSESEIKAFEHDKKQNVDNADIIRQCFNEWTEAGALSSDLKDSNMKVLHVTPKWNNANSFVSESEVLIVNYSRIRHEKSRENVSEEMERKTCAGESGDSDEVGKQNLSEQKTLPKSNNNVETLPTLQPNEKTNKIEEDLSDLKRELKQVLLDQFSQTKSTTCKKIKDKQQSNVVDSRENASEKQPSDLTESSKQSSEQTKSSEQSSEQTKSSEQSSEQTKSSKQSSEQSSEKTESSKQSYQEQTDNSEQCQCGKEWCVVNGSRDKREKIKHEESRAKKREKRERKCNTASTKKHRTKDMTPNPEATIYSANTNDGKTFNTRKKLNLLGNCKCASHEKLEKVSCCKCEHLKKKETSDENAKYSGDIAITDETSRNDSDKPSTDKTTLDKSSRDHTTSNQSSKDQTNSDKTSKQTTTDKYSKDVSDKPSRDNKNSDKTCTHYTTSDKPCRDGTILHRNSSCSGANPSMFKYLGQICYETLLPGDEYSSSKVDNILTMCEGKTPLGIKPNLMCSGKLTTSRRVRKSTTKKRRRSTRNEKGVSPDDVEDLKIRCASIRKQLESIESKAAMLKTKRKPKVVEPAGVLRESGEECHASNEGGYYMCTIM